MVKWLLVVVLVAVAARAARAGCEELGRCCPGKSSTQGCKFQEGWARGRFNRVCYCDEFCVRSRDCCSDYRAFCLSKAKDCVMSPWADWSDCNARCGPGFAERRRQIVSYAENGGKRCGSRRQTRGCYHNDPRCNDYKVAQILPHYFNYKRAELDYYQRPALSDQVVRPSYCLNYRVTGLSWSCRYASPYHMLEIGSTVCVECHDVAMDDEGECTGAYENVSGRWRALEGRPCYGTWTSVGARTANCTCDGQEQAKSYIFI